MSSKLERQVKRIIAACVLVGLALLNQAHGQTTSKPGARGLSSEQVHWLYGGAILAGSAVLLAEESGAFSAPKLRYGVPLAVMAAGGLLAIDPLLHGSNAPKNYGAETKQHLLIAGLLLTAGAVDVAYEANWLEHWSWGLVLPAGMVAAGVRFFFHAQHGAPSKHALLTAQHRILGATLVVAGIAKGLSVVPKSGTTEARWPGFSTGWLLPFALVGAELLLYTENTSPTKDSMKKHSMRLTVSPGGLTLVGVF